MRNDLKPVEKLEVKDNKVKIRIVTVVIAFIIGITALIYGFTSLLGGESGYQKINVGDDNAYMANDLSFSYNIGVNPNRTNTELKDLINLYSDYVEYSYKLLDPYNEYENVNNVYYLNKHPNEVIKVEPILYNSLKEISDKGMLYYTYLEPLYYQTTSIILGKEEGLDDYSPLHNKDVRNYYDEIYRYIVNSSISLEIFDDYMVRLNVNNEYLNYINTNKIDYIFSFGYLKNSVMVDYIASSLITKGFTYGIISSNDGYTRILGDNDEFNYSILDYNKRSYIACRGSFKGEYAIVNLRNYNYYSNENERIFSYNDELYSYYINENGEYLNTRKSLIMYKNNGACLNVALNMLDLFFNDYNSDKISNLATNKIYTIYCNNFKINYNDNNLKLSNFETADGNKYVEELI